jgi:hypothetical protein
VSDGESFVQDPVVAEYYASSFPREFCKKPKEPPLDNMARFAAYFGIECFPAELETFLRLRDTYQLNWTGLGEWRISDKEVWLPDPEKGNLVEQMITRDQQNYLGTNMLEYASHCIFLGSAGNGDAYFASLSGNTNGIAEVVYWSHDENALEFALADSLSSFAYANHLLEVAARDEVEYIEDDEEEEEEEVEDEDGNAEIDLPNIAEEFNRIRARVRLSWHYHRLEEVAQAMGCYESPCHTRYYFCRWLWINNLLRHTRELRFVAKAFDLVDHGQEDLERVIAAGSLPRYPVTAFYWLWRLFFMNKEDKLRIAIAIASASANPIVRDMALLVEELQNGRRQLGTIEDIHALREEFLKLGLDPDQAEACSRAGGVGAAGGGAESGEPLRPPSQHDGSCF